MHMLLVGFLMLVVSYIIQSFLVPKQAQQKPQALEDWEFPQADDGTPQPVVFGDCWLSGPMVLWYGNYRTLKIKAKGGKKG